MKKTLKLVLLALCVMLSGCDADDRYDSPYECNFLFYTSYHLNSPLTLALGNPGHFVTVEKKVVNGGIHIVQTTNYGQSEDLVISSDKETIPLRYAALGAHQRLIIGCTEFNGLRAYDGQCSNCLNQLGGLNYPLQWIQIGRKLQCTHCQRVYDPNADGIPIENAQKGDLALYQYIVSYNEERLHVYNGQPGTW